MVSNILEHAVALSQNNTIELNDLPRLIVEEEERVDQTQETQDSIVISIGQKIKEVERITILRTLDYLEGHRKKTASVLGISERSLRDKLKQYKSIKKR